VTSVVRRVRLELSTGALAQRQGAAAPLPRYSLAEADEIKGNFISSRAPRRGAARII
jgi:hypothetical protein